MKLSDYMKGNKMSAVTFTIHHDLVIDILFILHRHNVNYRIGEVDRDNNRILLYLLEEDQPEQLPMVIGNVESILEEYNRYLSGKATESNAGEESESID